MRPISRRPASASASPEGNAIVVQVMKTIHTRAWRQAVGVAHPVRHGRRRLGALASRPARRRRSPASTGCSARTSRSSPPPRPATRWRWASSTTSRPARRWPRPRAASSRWSLSQPPQPVFAIALRPKERKDEVKMSAALQRLAEEDPVAHACTTTRIRRDRAVRPWRDASARRRRAAGGQEPDPGRGPCAGGPLSRDDPQIGAAARPPQEAVRRPRPVRRRGDRDQAAAARLRLPVHRHHHRRRRAEATISSRSRPACATI